ncbi:molybdenum cofactor cytidylyltransferase [Rhodoligotrophos appendicifer]|uniref:NTP transferase domain-containing protein n=1 Tax=Rhodoligotrophos appendicifer TaxID=987056 RepID=UPI001184DC1C|nr:molybdopterin-binding/glycosyltransferase family 2 protein [Rhodoligotrophos appendicifer]
MIFGEISIDQAEGAVLAHSVRHAEGVFKKGRVLTSLDIAVLKTSGVMQVFAALLQENDVPEDEAAAILSCALPGSAVAVARPFTGRANLYAETSGLVLIDEGRLRRINRLHESLTVATLKGYELVENRQMIATVKIIPFATPRHILDRAIAIAKEGGPVVRIAPLMEHPVGLVVTILPAGKKSLVAKSVKSIEDRLSALGSTLKATRLVEHGIIPTATAIKELRDEGCGPILIFGASAIVDRGDIVPGAVVAAGGTVLHLGMPVDPGNLLMLGQIDGTPVIGVPTCARSPKLNGFDWVLQRLLAEVPVGAEEIMDMGSGGLLAEISSRPTPREGESRKVAKAPVVASIVLAAGRSTRMEGANKLLEPVDGKVMVRRVVEAALASRAAPVLVILGHQSERVRAALAELDVMFVENSAFSEGLSSSLKSGIAALPTGVDAALVCLGDMPFVTASHLDRLIAGFSPSDGRSICVSVSQGKRGNPVLWGADYFSDIQELRGDIGAKHLMSRYASEVCEIEMDDAVLIDLDTPEALAASASRAVGKT